MRPFDLFFIKFTDRAQTLSQSLKPKFFSECIIQYTLMSFIYWLKSGQYVFIMASLHLDKWLHLLKHTCKGDIAFSPCFSGAVRVGVDCIKNKTQRSTMRPQATFSFFCFFTTFSFFSLSSSLLPPRRSFLRVHPSSSPILPLRPSFLLVPPSFLLVPPSSSSSTV